MGNITKASERLLPHDMRVDVAALSDNAVRFTVPLTANAAMVVQNASRYLTYNVCHPDGIKVVGIYWGFSQTVPAQAGGTATVKVETLDKADGTTATSIMDALTVLSGVSAGIPLAGTLASTNPTSVAAGSVIRAVVAADNNAVGTADVGFGLTLLCEAVEPTTITE